MAPNGLIMYRSALFGGITSEVLRIFNESTLMSSLKGIKFADGTPLPFFDVFVMQLTAWFQERGWPQGPRLESATQRTTAFLRSGEASSTCPRSCQRTAT